jgi:hypothetical protein
LILTDPLFLVGIHFRYIDFAVDLLNPTLRAMAGSWWTRSWSVALLVWLVLFPLCSLKDLAALAPFSTLGAASVAYVLLFVVLRALDSTYEPGGVYDHHHFERGGGGGGGGGGVSSLGDAIHRETAPNAAFRVGRALLDTIAVGGVVGSGSEGGSAAVSGIGGGHHQPHFEVERNEAFVDFDALAELTSVLHMEAERGKGGWGMWAALVGVFKCCQLFALVSVGFLSHYNAGDYYRGLQDATPRKFAKVSGVVFSGSAAVYCAIMVAGAATFGEHAAPTILSSYHPTDDVFALVGRLGIGASLLASFPLMFNGLRRSVTLLLLGSSSSSSSSASALSATSASSTALASSSSFDLQGSSMNPVASAVVTATAPAAAAAAGIVITGGGSGGSSSSSSSSSSTGGSGDAARNRTVVCLLLACHCASHLLPDVGLIVGVVGALFGSATIFALPAALALAHEENLATASSSASSSSSSSYSPDKTLSRSSSDLAAASLPGPTTDLLGGNEKGHASAKQTAVYWRTLCLALLIAVTGMPYEALLLSGGER